MLLQYAPFLVPICAVAIFSYFSWSSLTHPWLFVAIGIMGMFALMVVLGTIAFQDIGVSRLSDATAKPLFSPLNIRFIFLTAVFIALSAFGLWGLKLLMKKG